MTLIGGRTDCSVFFVVVHLDVMISAKKLANLIYLEINLALFLNFLKTLARVCSRKTGNVLMGESFQDYS